MERRELIELVERLIEKYDLKNKCRFQKYTYPRYYLYAVLKNNARMSLTQIGKIFDKDHASVLHGIKVHNNFNEINDLSYKYITASIRDEIKVKEQKLERDLTKDVLSCRTFNQLKQLQTKLQMGYYD